MIAMPTGTGAVTRFQSVLVPLIDGVSAHRYQIGVEGERGPKRADQQKMEPSPPVVNRPGSRGDQTLTVGQFNSSFR